MAGHEPPASRPIVACAVQTPLRRAFDYLIPHNIDPGAVMPGNRVQVPFGRRQVVALILHRVDVSTVDPMKLKPITAVLDEQPLLDPLHQQLMRWVSDYYLHPIGEVYPLALSPCERRGEPPASMGEPGLKLTLRGQGLPENALKRSPRQAQLLALLQAEAQPLSALRDAGISTGIVRQLIAKDLAVRCQIDGNPAWNAGPPLPPSSEQQEAISAIRDTLGGYRCHLLDGITGSGKTEVYLQAIASCIAGSRQALLLLPEIGLTPQMLARFKERFDAPIVVLHSGLSDGERDRGWSAARAGKAAIVIGTRSAVFVPLARPGLIIVDEEHDAGYSQQDGLRYSARDVAVKRGHLADCTVVLGSATPSIESLDNVNRGRYQLLRLRQRAGGASLPSARAIDVRGLALRGGLSTEMLDTVRQTLDRGEQALLFVHRRGFAAGLQCHDCGWVAQCRHCDAGLAVHRHPIRLRCHHCGWNRDLPGHCQHCGGSRLASTGVGTEQSEAVLAAQFPGTALYRVDSDTMTGKGSRDAFHSAVRDPAPAIMIGTQMLTKGHHFPRVTLVGVVDADNLLFNPDFRGEERLLQLLYQVAGRAGRGDHPGQVLLQTRHPEHPIIARALREEYGVMAAEIIEQRYQRGLPPVGAMAVMRCDSTSLDQGIGFLQQVKREMNTTASTLIGPLPAAMARRAGRFRSQLIVMADTRRALALAMNTLVAVAEALPRPSGLNWFVDIDPIETL
ncbi:primosomal protein N' [Luminiphilus syltensis NOR5-1B]|uniref:Replication restart protein PriA n=1 Tax=Luminiphilus syltensis NOR5-1B TaxID=565045 RepID=B8KUT0_9GAMM|nr:primosomal protein N' [Luminiphilus syltensis]EED34745.1 primosomal protein N' [Luminiphilus syltensis NOR5-1B]